MILGWTNGSSLGGPLVHADAQCVFVVASPNDVYLRYKDMINMTDEAKKQFKRARDMPYWDETIAQEIVHTWQRNFTKRMYNHIHNFDADGNMRRTIHPLVSACIADMLEEFCQFSYIIILVGYGLMLAYVMFTNAKYERYLQSSQACMGFALAVVFTTTFASVA